MGQLASQYITDEDSIKETHSLSPLLFILAIDPLQRILDIATQHGLLTLIGADPVKIRTSLCIDDATLFIRPITTDVSNLHCLLQQFGKATGLAVNIQKSEIFPINCSIIDLPSVLGEFQVQQGEFHANTLDYP